MADTAVSFVQAVKEKYCSEESGEGARYESDYIRESAMYMAPGTRYKVAHSAAIFTHVACTAC